MRNPIKFIQEVKQEAFKVTWPTWKETLQGALMVFVMAVVMSLFFLLLDQVLKFFLKSNKNIFFVVFTKKIISYFTLLKNSKGMTCQFELGYYEEPD